MSKLHPVEVMRRACGRHAFRAVLAHQALGTPDAWHRESSRLSFFIIGYGDVFEQSAELRCLKEGTAKQGYLAGRRAAEKWLAGCPVRKLEWLSDSGGDYLGFSAGQHIPEDAAMEGGTYRLERIGE